jgi:aspartyl-tRNA(Asn)/glutamyl-tRNA(Gln) amidotransferase subunit C
MKIDDKVVEHVAHLARLQLEAHELELYTQQLDRILAYMDKLNSLDTTGIEPTSHVIPLVNVFREEDVADHNFQVEESVGNAPERKGSSFKVPPIMEVG